MWDMNWRNICSCFVTVVLTVFLFIAAIFLPWSQSATVANELEAFEKEHFANLYNTIVPRCCLNECSYMTAIESSGYHSSSINYLAPEEIHQIAKRVKIQFIDDLNCNNIPLNEIHSALDATLSSIEDNNFQVAHFLEKILRPDHEAIKNLLRSSFGGRVLFTDFESLPVDSFIFQVHNTAATLESLPSLRCSDLVFPAVFETDIRRLRYLQPPPTGTNLTNWKLNIITTFKDLISKIDEKICKHLGEQQKIIRRYAVGEPLYAAKLAVRKAIVNYFYSVAERILAQQKNEAKGQKQRMKSNRQPFNHNDQTQNGPPSNVVPNTPNNYNTGNHASSYHFSQFPINPSAPSAPSAPSTEYCKPCNPQQSDSSQYFHDNDLPPPYSKAIQQSQGHPHQYQEYSQQSQGYSQQSQGYPRQKLYPDLAKKV